jgi:hypothetical protein
VLGYLLSKSEGRRRMATNFPFEVVETSGEDALAKWEELTKAGRGAPVVLGSKIVDYLPALNTGQTARLPSVDDILAEAASINFPDDLLKLRREELARARAYLAKRNPSINLDMEEEDREPPLGDWPSEISVSSGLSVVTDFAVGIRSNVQIALIPTDDPSTIPAHLHWGHWNACPPPAYHVAALRAWRTRYGAELVGMDGDTLNLRVSLRPASRDEALKLARMQYLYCNDIVDQGVGLRALAAYLMEQDWWFFWWD